MFLKSLTLISVLMLLVGCASSPKKTEVQLQPSTSYQQVISAQGYEESWPAVDYEKPVKKAYSGVAVHLSLKQIQRALKNAGFYQGVIDGRIGARTKEAIVKFQKANGLKPDGIVGKRTTAALNKYLTL